MCHSKNLPTFEKSERASEMEGEKEKEHVREEIGRRKENYCAIYEKYRAILFFAIQLFLGAKVRINVSTKAEGFTCCRV